MKIRLAVLGFYVAALHAMTSNLHLEHDASPITPFKLTSSTSSRPDLMGKLHCEPGSICEPSNVVGYCNVRPSQQATVLGASKCVESLLRKRPKKPITLAGSRIKRLEKYTSRNKALESVATFVGVWSPNGLGKKVSREVVARMIEDAVQGCRRPDCKGGRCPMSVVSADMDGTLEVWIWGESDNVEWRPEANLRPSAAVVGKEGVHV